MFRLSSGFDVGAASGPEQAILAASAGNVLTRYADLSGLSRYGSNDIVADGRGNIYVDNVNFHFAAGPPDGEPAPGFIALVTPDGQTRMVAEDLAFPNGMAVHGRQRHPRRRRVISASAHGLRHRLRRFAGEPPRVGAGGDYLPDGICLDRDGAAWYADVGDRRAYASARAATS